MSKCDTLKGNYIFDIFLPSNFQLIKAHKRALIHNYAGFLEISTGSDQNLASAGFRFTFELKPYQLYQLEIEAELLKGDKAFIYCESMNNERLIPRNFLIKNKYNKKPTFYKLSFFPNNNNPRVQIGILFFNGGLDYLMHLTHLKIKEISNNLNPILKSIDHYPKIKHQKIKFVGISENLFPTHIEFLEFKDQVIIFLPNIEEFNISPFIQNSYIIYNSNKLIESIRPPNKLFFQTNNHEGLIIEIRPDGTLLIYYHNYQDFRPNFTFNNVIIGYNK